MKAFGRRRVRLAELEIVVVGKLIAPMDIATAFYEDSFVFIDDFTIGRAGMVNPTRRVAPPGCINDDLIVDFEEHGVRRILVHFRVTIIRFLL